MSIAAPERTEGAMVRLAGVIGCTEGQAYTAVLGIAIALVAALLGLPPTLRDVTEAAGSGGESAVSAAPAPPPNSDTPAPPADGSAVPAPGALARPPGGVAPEAPPVAAAPAPGVVAAPAAPTPDVAPSEPAGPVVGPATGFGTVQLAARVGAPGAPDGAAVDADGRILVATNNALVRGQPGPSKVIRYGPDGKAERELVVQGQDGARTAGLTGLTITADGTVLALDSAPPRVLRLDLDRGRQTTYAPLTDLPACGPTAPATGCESGADDRAQPRAIVSDATGALFVSDSGQGVIWRIPPGGRPVPWFVFPPTDAAARPTGIALDAAGDLLVASTVSLQPSAGASQVQRIQVRGDGAAGERTTVAELNPLSGPAGLAVAPGGGIAVALSTANVLVLLGSDGTERARLTAEQVEAAAGVPLDGPTGVALRGRSVVVTNQSPTANDESHWAVFDVPLAP